MGTSSVAAGDPRIRSTPDGLVFISGVLPATREAGVPDRLRPTSDHDDSAMEAQARYALDEVDRLLRDAGSGLDAIIKAEIFLTDVLLFSAFDDVWRSKVPTSPPRTIAETGPQGFLAAGALVQLDVVAARLDAPVRPEMFRSASHSPSDPVDAHSCRYGDLVFIGGLSAVEPGTTKVRSDAGTDSNFPFDGSAIELQTDSMLRQLSAVLDETDSDRTLVGKAQVLLKDLKDFHGFHEVWRAYFGTTPPSTTVQVRGFLAPEARCQVELIAARRLGEASVRPVMRVSGPRPLKHAQGSVVGAYALPAGHVATDFENGVAPEARVDPRFPFYGSDIERQTEYTLDYLQGVLEASGSSLDRSVRAQVFMRDLDDFHGFDKIWRRRFTDPPPRTLVQVAGHGLLTPGTLVEIDVIALTG